MLNLSQEKGGGRIRKADRQKSASKPVQQRTHRGFYCVAWLPTIAWICTYTARDIYRKDTPIHCVRMSCWQTTGGLQKSLAGNTQCHKVEGREAASKVSAVSLSLQGLSNTTRTEQFSAALWDHQKHGRCWRPCYSFHKSALSYLSKLQLAATEKWLWSDRLKAAATREVAQWPA